MKHITSVSQQRLPGWTKEGEVRQSSQGKDFLSNAYPGENVPVSIRQIRSLGEFSVRLPVKGGNLRSENDSQEIRLAGGRLYYPEGRWIVVGGQKRTLINSVNSLLAVLVEYQGEIVSSEALAKFLWEESTKSTTRRLGTFISILRSKLRFNERDTKEQSIIDGIKNVGYRLQIENSSEVVPQSGI